MATYDILGGTEVRQGFKRETKPGVGVLSEKGFMEQMMLAMSFGGWGEFP